MQVAVHRMLDRLKQQQQQASPSPACAALTSALSATGQDSAPGLLALLAGPGELLDGRGLPWTCLPSSLLQQGWASCTTINGRTPVDEMESSCLCCT